MLNDVVMEIRLATPNDAAGIAAVYGPYVTDTAISFETDVPSAGEMAERLRLRMPLHPWLVLEETWNDGFTRDVVGYAYAGPFAGRAAYRWSVETSVYLAGSACGAGWGRVLYQALLDLLSEQGYRQALGGIALPNEPSVRLHERCGFTPAGTYRAVGWKLGRWHDVGWWQLPLGEPGAEPGEVVPLDELDPVVVTRAIDPGRR